MFRETLIEIEIVRTGVCDHEVIIQDYGFWICEHSPWHKLLWRRVVLDFCRVREGVISGQ